MKKGFFTILAMILLLSLNSTSFADEATGSGGYSMPIAQPGATVIEKRSSQKTPLRWPTEATKLSSGVIEASFYATDPESGTCSSEAMQIAVAGYLEWKRVHSGEITILPAVEAERRPLNNMTIEKKCYTGFFVVYREKREVIK